ncbi:hypothetical protein [Halosimplex marinum]|uniref:hypothetical protein n=1 Tax=Halosimplex marinum TaxID=3396620 RepID=UPI003F5605CA
MTLPICALLLAVHAVESPVWATLGFTPVRPLFVAAAHKPHDGRVDWRDGVAVDRIGAAVLARRPVLGLPVAVPDADRYGHLRGAFGVAAEPLGWTAEWAAAPPGRRRGRSIDLIGDRTGLT